MRAGLLRHRVMLQRPVQDLDPQGNPVTVWEDVGEVWAAVEPLRGREQIEAQQAFGEVTTRVRIRYRPDVRKSWRIVWEGRVLEVRSPVDVRGMHVEWELLCAEVVQ